ncbi:Notch signaling pathway -1 [Fasciola hepatica]|uniref:Notch signaling pathway -1 n=1 Tax=Fasciola hepatica TaxID=6192 RepID=A0A4E0RI02_FASHE|nr:Notch signaling pathway -1 [Fasciola hepatica]
MCVDMDPVSIFEDALKGLATKDLNDNVTSIPEHVKPEAPRRNPLITNSPLSIALTSDAPPPAEDAKNDIILSALIKAGITPSTLKSEARSDSATQLVPHPVVQPATNVKVLSAKGATVFKIVPSPSSGVSSPGQQPSLKMTSQLLRGSANKNGIVMPQNSPRMPNIIRKRPQPFVDNLSHPAAKIRRATSNFETEHPTADSLYPNVPATGLSRWYDSSRLLQPVGQLHNAKATTFPMNYVKPYMMKRDDEMEEDEDLAQAETYAEYVPMKLKLGSKHPDPVVESSSLSSVVPPEVHYPLTLPDEVVDRGCLSALQLEAVVYACQRHECILPNGQRAGFLIGDGAGVGKGRTIAGILYENYIRHRKKAIWLSVSNDLKVDAERDLRDVGLGRIKVHSLNKFKYARISGKANGRVKKGVIFSTYSSLIGESQGSAKAKYKTRLKQLVHWCGKKFDGLIVFDECHRAKNLTPSGTQKPTKTGLTVLELQNRLPNARIVYASATGATEPRNMAYMTRLGLWGDGTPFKTFNSFIQTLERRGVGAMELVAMDMKLRGMYIARQLSFHGVHFTIKEVAIEDVRLKNTSFIQVYNQSADLWVYAYRFFSEASRLLNLTDRYRKTMWGQFWSAHQRFFKYLCIAAKVDSCVELTKAAISEGKCVVIGLQSTGEAKTLEQVEELGSDLGDFVSSTKGVFQSLVEKYFPTPNNLENFVQRGDRLASVGDRNSHTTLSRAGRAVAGGQGSGLGLKDILGEKMLAKLVAGGSLSGSTLDGDGDNADEETKLDGKGPPDSDDDDDDDNDKSDDSADEDSDTGADGKSNGFGSKSGRHSSSSDYFDSDLEVNSSSTGTKRTVRKGASKKLYHSARKKPRNANDGSSSNDGSEISDDCDPDALFDSFMARNAFWSHANPEVTSDGKVKRSTTLTHDFLGDDSMRELSCKYFFRRDLPTENDGLTTVSSRPSPEEAKRQCTEMQNLLLRFIEKLGAKLPPSSLDELIDKLGGPSCVAEMTGRKGRVVMGEDGRVTYESRREFDVNLEILNLTEKQRFMDGEKLIAIISEAASSGISLQADRRAINQRRRVHITLELPWSADRAIQQFGRTHRSNQVSAPKYIFLISNLAGEQRFASTVAKRLESLGALTHGDRRATDTRDLSQFNIDTKLGREALDIVLRSCLNGEDGVVEPPPNYVSESPESALDASSSSQFFMDMKASLQGVGLVAGRSRDKDTGQISKFLNRMLGLRVHIQTVLFRYFSDTLEELTRRAKRDNRLDLGIMDLGTSGQNMEIVWTKSFDTWFLSDKTQVHLHKVTAERGLTWAAAMEIYTQHDGMNDGFYLPVGANSMRVVIPILAVYVKSRPSTRLSGGKSETKYYRIYRPNTGMQSRPMELEKLLERYSRVSNPSDCQDAWHRVCKESATRCIHMLQHNMCPRAAQQRTLCEVGLRVRTYYVLSGSVLNVWAQIEPLLQGRSSQDRCMQVVRLKSKDGNRIIGSLIPPECVDDVLNCLSSPPGPFQLDAIHDTPFGKMTPSHRATGIHRTAQYRLPMGFNQGMTSLQRQRSWQRRATPYHPRGAHLFSRGYHPGSQLPFSLRDPGQYTMRPRGPVSPSHALYSHGTPTHFPRYGSPLNPQIQRVDENGSQRTQPILGERLNARVPSPTSGYSHHSMPTSYSSPSVIQSLHPRLSGLDLPRSELSPLAPRRSGSRLNAALSIPLDTPNPSSTAIFNPNRQVTQMGHQTPIFSGPTSFPHETVPNVSFASAHDSRTTSSSNDSSDTTRRVPNKMTKFKIKWKEG